MAKYILRVGSADIEYDADEVVLVAKSGFRFSITERKSDGEVCLCSSRAMQIQPVASNMVYLQGSEKWPG